MRIGKNSSSALAKNWDGQQLQQDVEAQAKITEAFGKQAALAVGNYAESQLKKAQAAGDADGIAKWKEGGAYRTALHAAAGALSGGVAGAAGATASSLSMPAIAEAIEKMDAPDAVKLALGQVAAGAIGAAVGGGQGLASAVHVEANNRQLHQSERDWAQQNAKRFAQHYKEQTGQTIDDQRAEQVLLGDGYRMVDTSASKGPGVAGPAGDAVAVSFIALNANGLFKATAAERNDPGPLGGPLTPEQLALPGATGNPALGLATAAVVTGGAAAAGSGAAAVVSGAVDAWTAYRAASAAYSMKAAFGTGMAVGGASYTGGAALESVFDRNATFGSAFLQRFSYPSLATSMLTGGLSGVYSTSMFSWAGVPNALGNWATVPGSIIRINNAVIGQTAGRAAQSAINSDTQ